MHIYLYLFFLLLLYRTSASSAPPGSIYRSPVFFLFPPLLPSFSQLPTTVYVCLLFVVFWSACNARTCICIVFISLQYRNTVIFAYTNFVYILLFSFLSVLRFRQRPARPPPIHPPFPQPKYTSTYVHTHVHFTVSVWWCFVAGFCAALRGEGGHSIPAPPSHSFSLSGIPP